MVSLWVFHLDPSVFQPVFVRRELMEANLVAPETILAASLWILSRSFDSYCLQLSQTASANSKSGRINEK